jgi:hypothetical protein
MLTAIGDNCDDFPEPQNPADLESFYSEHTTSSEEYESTTAITPTTPTTPEEGDEEQESADPTGDPNYDPDLYAPGAGQDPEPATEQPAEETGPPVDTGPPPDAGPADGGVTPK